MPFRRVITHTPNEETEDPKNKCSPVCQLTPTYKKQKLPVAEYGSVGPEPDRKQNKMCNHNNRIGNKTRHISRQEKFYS